MNFFHERVAPRLKDHEGGYVWHPSDPGGETIHGLTAKVARQRGFTGPMRTMTWATAADIYEQAYYIELGLPPLEGYAPELAIKLCDVAVNQGPHYAGEFLQVALNTLNRQGRDYPDVKVDGDIGPGTRSAVQALQKARGVKLAELVLIEAVRAQQTVRYMTVANANVKLEDFMWGWFTRARA